MTTLMLMRDTATMAIITRGTLIATTRIPDMV
jgi:hypothetical protein